MSESNAGSEGYNGHPSWEHWNVALWLGNDEGLYNMAMDALRKASPSYAAVFLAEELEALGLRETPDGAPYTVVLLERALEGLADDD